MRLSIDLDEELCERMAGDANELGVAFKEYLEMCIETGWSEIQFMQTVVIKGRGKSSNEQVVIAPPPDIK